MVSEVPTKGGTHTDSWRKCLTLYTIMRAVGEKDIIRIGNRFCNQSVGDTIECVQGYSLTFQACIGGPADGAGTEGAPGLLRTMELQMPAHSYCGSVPP